MKQQYKSNLPQSHIWYLYKQKFGKDFVFLDTTYLESAIKSNDWERYINFRCRWITASHNYTENIKSLDLFLEEFDFIHQKILKYNLTYLTDFICLITSFVIEIRFMNEQKALTFLERLKKHYTR